LVTGTRDYIRYFDNPSLGLNADASYKLEDVITFMTSDEPQNMLTGGNGQLFNYYPTKKFFIDVDKEAVIASGRVPLRDTGRIVERIEWNIGKGAMYKGDLVVLDLIATNAREGWKRPIYWTTTAGRSVFLNLDNYLRHNGLTYELIPVQRINRGYMGMDDMGMLYDKLMNVYVWGNMEKGEMFLDDKATLLPGLLRSLFVQVGDYYSQKGRADSSIAVVEKCFEVIPEKILPMDLGLKILCGEVYYRAGNNDEGDRLFEEVAKDAEELVRYHMRFGNEFLYKRQLIRENLKYLGEVVSKAKNYKRNDMVTRYEAIYNQLQVGLN
jgi:tetratricopeptide (TPR) repeat protein